MPSSSSRKPMAADPDLFTPFRYDNQGNTRTWKKYVPREEDKEIYKNVLTFPKGTEHLKYFEKNPHPDRIPDNELAIYEAMPKVDLNVNLLQRLMEYNLVKKYLAPKLGGIDQKIIRMPEKMQKMIDAGAKGDRLTAFTHLRDSFINYFTTPTDDSVVPDIQWIDFPFAVNYEPAQIALDDLRQNLFNNAAMLKLLEKLNAAGAFGDKVQNFYFWNSDPQYWSDISYQARSAKYMNWSFPQIPGTLQRIEEGCNKLLFNEELPPQYLALGDFTINALPEGRVTPKGNGKYEICIDKVFIFINDRFNFEGEEYLGKWDLDNITGDTLLVPLFELRGDRLYNSYFKQFSKHGYGRSFPVLSRLQEIENFYPICKDYQFVK